LTRCVTVPPRRLMALSCSSFETTIDCTRDAKSRPRDQRVTSPESSSCEFARCDSRLRLLTTQCCRSAYSCVARRHSCGHCHRPSGSVKARGAPVCRTRSIADRDVLLIRDGPLGTRKVGRHGCTSRRGLPESQKLLGGPASHNRTLRGDIDATQSARICTAPSAHCQGAEK
jgi:hypothetical protein